MRFVANTGDQVLAFPLRPGSTIIGRHATCHICLPSKGVSRRHAQVYIDGASVVLRDLGSSHGTCVNGQRVERADLRDGDVVSIGGVQMRFEGGVPAGAAFAHSAAPAQDIVVTAEPAGPAGAAPTGPAPAYPPGGGRTAEDRPPVEFAEGPDAQGAPAPTDFPESPKGDETPVDQAFVPQPYTAPQPSMLPSATLQPQMVIRDGRWYLRDPRTGREVEIAPKDAALAPATQAVPVELRRPNVRFLLAAVGAAVFVVIAFALFFLGPQQGGDGPKVLEFPTPKYYALVDEAIDQFHKGKLDEALAILDDASKKRPNIGTAGHLSLYIRLCKSAGTNLDIFSWTDASRYLDSVLHSQSVSEAARAFVSEQTRWIQGERTAIGLLEEAKGLLREGPDSDDVLKAAYNALNQLPKDTFAARKAEGEKLKIRTSLFDLYKGRAKRSEAERKWPDAVTQWREAMGYTDDTATIRKQIVDCERFGRDARDLEMARKEFEDKSYDAAEPRLKAITPPSPYVDDAKALLAQIAAVKEGLLRKQQVEEVAGLYVNGSGLEAAKLAENYGLKDFAYIKERVERWEKVMGEADAAEKAKNYETALTQFQEAVGVEPDAKNSYHRQADTRLQSLKGRFTDIGAEIAKEAAKIAETNPRKARADAERALKFDPEQPLARSILQNLQHRATLLYTEGSAHIDKKHWVDAERCLRVAHDCADPTKDVYGKIQQALEKIPKEE